MMMRDHVNEGELLQLPHVFHARSLPKREKSCWRYPRPRDIVRSVRDESLRNATVVNYR
jgi:hypothetical protein